MALPNAQPSRAPRLLVLDTPITIGSNTTLCIQDTVIINLAQFPFILADETSTVSLENCSIVLSDDYYWKKGKLNIKGICHILGPHTWHQQIPGACLISHNSTLILGSGITFYYEPSESNQAGILFNDQSSTLQLSSSHLRSGDHGLTLTIGTVRIEGPCSVHAENNTPQRGIFFGSGTSYKENITLELLGPEARLTVTGPYFQERSRGSFTRKAFKFCGNTVLACALCAGIMTIMTKLTQD